MSRLRRAAVAASFGYIQYGLAILSGLVLVPMTIHYLGIRSYGLWLASGELLGYAAMVDLGVVGVLPWMLAEADGRRDRLAMRGLVVNGLVVGAVVGLAYALLSAVLWVVLPSMLSLTPADRQAVGTPLALLVAALTVAYPLRVFSAVVAGLQDVSFNGWLSVAQAVVGIAITASMLHYGYGLVALASASAASSLLVGIGAFARTMIIAPDLLRGWPRPSHTAVRSLLTNGLGVWFGAFGWQLLSASNALVMTALGRPEWVAIYACTSKLTSMATQLAWVTPDAGLIGLAQVHGEGRGAARLRPLVLMLLRIHLVLSGGAAVGLLAFNPAFVVRWVGAGLFGGGALNALLAFGIVVSSFVHGLLSAAAVVGRRIHVGTVTLISGAFQVAAACLLGQIFGMAGVAAAGLLIGLLTTVPAGVRLLAAATALTHGELWTALVRPWTMRALPILALAAAAGLSQPRLGLAGGCAAAACAGSAYIWAMRGLLVDLPFDARWTGWLVSLRLMPAPAPTLERA
jgi:O-antigen/teichoic acid export membrane protein